MNRVLQRLFAIGDDHRQRFRAKFFQQYRLFFRYHAASKVLVYAWVNDEHTKRAFDRSDDAYRVFRKMLESGHPPDGWDRLLAEAQKEPQRMQESLSRKGAEPAPSPVGYRCRRVGPARDRARRSHRGLGQDTTGSLTLGVPLSVTSRVASLSQVIHRHAGPSSDSPFRSGGISACCCAACRGWSFQSDHHPEPGADRPCGNAHHLSARAPL